MAGFTKGERDAVAGNPPCGPEGSVAILKILLTSYFFHPSIGGIETVSRRLAEDFTALGHTVKVVTLSESPNPGEYGYEVVRRPSPGRLLSLARWCDVYFQNNISLNLAWPLLIVRRPWVVAHHTYIARTDLKLSRVDRFKLWLLRFAHNISISGPIAATVPVPSTIIGNPYDDQLFRVMPSATRTRELIFVGRLVSDKGLDLLLEALVALRGDGLRPGLTVVGQGPELEALQAFTRANELEGQVEFLGYKTGRDLVELLNRHLILVAPSRWAEPFGLVAIEGIACGCVIVGSEGGGLKEAIGPCGVTFPNNSAAGLREALKSLLTDPKHLEGLRSGAGSHLARFRRATAAQSYLEVLAKAAGKQTCEGGGIN